MCGRFLAIVTEYLKGFASQHYKNLGTIRAAVGPFMFFLNERGIIDLERLPLKRSRSSSHGRRRLIIKTLLTKFQCFQVLSSGQIATVIASLVVRSSLSFTARSAHTTCQDPIPQRRYYHLELAQERGNHRVRATFSSGKKPGSA